MVRIGFSIFFPSISLMRIRIIRICSYTQFFRTQPEKTISVEGILEQVYLALKEKGYNPVNQIVGYIMSGDPTYITSHNNARSLIMKVERDELVEEVIKYFIEGKGL